MCVGERVRERVLIANFLDFTYFRLFLCHIENRSLFVLEANYSEHRDQNLKESYNFYSFLEVRKKELAETRIKALFPI